jgi:hypothetical protein
VRKDKFEGTPAQTMKIYRRRRSISPLILKLGTVGSEFLTAHFGNFRKGRATCIQ